MTTISKTTSGTVNPGPSPGKDGFLQNQGAWIDQGGRAHYNVDVMFHLQTDHDISTAKFNTVWTQNFNPHILISLCRKSWVFFGNSGFLPQGMLTGLVGSPNLTLPS
jgi:hypothetical protein